MTKPLITLPCMAQELENALHAVCDHDGLWGAKISTEDVFVRASNVPGISHIRKTQLVLCDDAKITDDTKEETK